MLTAKEPASTPAASEPRKSIRVYNTLSKTKEPFEPVTPGQVGIYSVRADGLQAEPRRPHGRPGNLRRRETLPALLGLSRHTRDQHYRR